MPFFAVTRIRRLLSQAGTSLRGAKLLVLGAAFKRDIDDPRNSPAVRVMEILRSEGAVVQYHDALVPEVSVSDGVFSRNGEGARSRSVELDRTLIHAADCVVILVGHSSVDYDMALANARLVFDCVNVTRGVPADRSSSGSDRSVDSRRRIVLDGNAAALVHRDVGLLDLIEPGDVLLDHAVP
jgi:UDP-N-acetyl-D-glucosamine dehydrogenase